MKNYFNLIIGAVLSLMIITLSSCGDSENSTNAKDVVKIQSSTNQSIQLKTSQPNIGITPELAKEKENKQTITQQQDKNNIELNSNKVKNDLLDNSIFSNMHLIVEDDFVYQHTDSSIENYSPYYSEEDHLYGPSLKWSKSSSKMWTNAETERYISVGPAEYGGTSYLELNQKYYTDLDSYIATVEVEEYSSNPNNVDMNGVITPIREENKPQAGFFIGKSFIGGSMDRPTDLVSNMISCGLLYEKAILTLIRTGNEVTLYKNNMLFKTFSLKKEGENPEEFGICNTGGPIRFSNFKFYGYDAAADNSSKYSRQEVNQGQSEKSVRTIVYDAHSFSDTIFGEYSDNSNKYWISAHDDKRACSMMILNPIFYQNLKNFTVSVDFQREDSDWHTNRNGQGIGIILGNAYQASNGMITAEKYMYNHTPDNPRRADDEIDEANISRMNSFITSKVTHSIKIEIHEGDTSTITEFYDGQENSSSTAYLQSFEKHIISDEFNKKFVDLGVNKEGIKSNLGYIGLFFRGEIKATNFKLTHD